MILLHASFTILGLARYWDLGNELPRALAPRVLLVDVLDGDSLNIVVWLRRVFLVIIGQEVFAVESAPCDNICQQRSYQQLAASGKWQGTWYKRCLSNLPLHTDRRSAAKKDR